MLKKLFNFVYLLILVAIAVVALAIGSSNGDTVTVNLQFISCETTLAVAMAGGVFFGCVFMSFLWCWIIIKQHWVIMGLRHQLKTDKTEL